MDLKGKKIAILVENFYEDQELWYPNLRLREAGAEITLVGPEAKTYTSKHGYPVTADVSVANIKAEDFDAVIIPGGYAPDHMRRNPAMVRLVRDAARSDKVVAAICHGGWMLASADVVRVRGKHITCFHSIKDDMIHAGANYEDSEVVIDGNLITSRQPSDLPAFCREVVNALAKVALHA